MRCPSCSGRGAVSSTATALARLIGSIPEGDVSPSAFSNAKSLYLQLVTKPTTSAISSAPNSRRGRPPGAGATRLRRRSETKGDAVGVGLVVRAHHRSQPVVVPSTVTLEEYR